MREGSSRNRATLKGLLSPFRGQKNPLTHQTRKSIMCLSSASYRRRDIRTAGGPSPCPFTHSDWEPCQSNPTNPTTHPCRESALVVGRHSVQPVPPTEWNEGKTNPGSADLRPGADYFRMMRLSVHETGEAQSPSGPLVLTQRVKAERINLWRERAMP